MVPKLLHIDLPSDKLIEFSENNQGDSFYKLPREIDCFISRCNNELPEGWRMLPWTINRCCTLKRNGETVTVIPYESIENGGVVFMLDYVIDASSTHPK